MGNKSHAPLARYGMLDLYYEGKQPLSFLESRGKTGSGQQVWPYGF